MSSRALPDEIIDVPAAAKVIRAGLFTDGQRVGRTPDGWPMSVKFGTLVVDMRTQNWVK